MLASSVFYILVGNHGFTIKNEQDSYQYCMELPQMIPNVPFYYHLFDKDKLIITEITKQIKELKAKKAVIIMPDDAMEIYADQKILEDFFMICGSKKLTPDYQCFHLTKDNKFISLSKSARTLMLQYISNGKSLSKKYNDRDFQDIDRIKWDMSHLHIDCGYGSIPVYLNNIDQEMESLRTLGFLVYIDDIFANLMKK
jgi:hypothetical protein